MKLWRLIPVAAFVGVLAAATVGLAAVQDINEPDHNFAAEGEADAKSCDEIEVEYRQSHTPPVGHVTGVKLHYPPGNNQQNHCGGERAGVEVHNSGHEAMCSGSKVLETDGNTNIACSPAIPNLPGPCGPTDGCVEDIDHINIVITDLPPLP